MIVLYTLNGLKMKHTFKNYFKGIKRALKELHVNGSISIIDIIIL